MQMLTIALPAMSAAIADPERLRPVRIETRGACLAYTRGMLIHAQPALAFSSACSQAKSSPVEQIVGQVIRITSSHLGVLGCLPRAARRHPHPLTQHLHNLGTLCQSKSVRRLLEVQLFVNDVFKGQPAIHKRHCHHICNRLSCRSLQSSIIQACKFLSLFGACSESCTLLLL